MTLSLSGDFGIIDLGIDRLLVTLRLHPQGTVLERISIIFGVKSILDIFMNSSFFIREFERHKQQTSSIIALINQNSFPKIPIHSNLSVLWKYRTPNFDSICDSAHPKLIKSTPARSTTNSFVRMSFFCSLQPRSLFCMPQNDRKIRIQSNYSATGFNYGPSLTNTKALADKKAKWHITTLIYCVCSNPTLHHHPIQCPINANECCVVSRPRARSYGNSSNGNEFMFAMASLCQGDTTKCLNYSWDVCFGPPNRTYSHAWMNPAQCKGWNKIQCICVN